MKTMIKASEDKYVQDRELVDFGKRGAAIADELDDYLNAFDRLNESRNMRDYLSGSDTAILEDAYTILKDTYMYIKNDNPDIE